MREILFRGKRLDNGEWIEGDLSHLVHDEGEVIGNIHDQKKTAAP